MESIMPTIVKDRSGIFFVVYTVNGKRIWKSSKSKNKEDALKLLWQKPTFEYWDEQKNDHAELSISHCREKYLEYVGTNFSQKTHRIYSDFTKHLVEFMGDRPAKSITTFQLEQYKVKRSKEISAVSINTEFRCIKAFFNTLMKWELIEKNPCLLIKPLKISSAPPEYLTMQHLEMLSNSIEDRWLRDIIIFTAMTGLRLGEVVHLDWKDIDLENKSILVRSNDNFQVKGGGMRKVPLNITALDLLQSLNSRTGTIFRGHKGGSVKGSYVSRRFKKAVVKNGESAKLHFHSLRHTFASLLVKNGVSLYQVQKLLGHTTPRVTQMYAHLQNDEMHSLVDKIAM
jgi:site-specific recombinase XerD